MPWPSRAPPRLVDDRWVAVGYDAACSAVLAGCGRDRHQPTLDEADRLLSQVAANP